jgi:hypothetical protein
MLTAHALAVHRAGIASTTWAATATTHHLLGKPLALIGRYLDPR